MDYYRDVNLCLRKTHGEGRILVARKPTLLGSRRCRLRVLCSSSGLDFLTTILTRFPNAPFLASTVVALTLAGGSYAYGRKGSKQVKDSLVERTGYWLLALRPTHFNRFVIARCPSICLDSCRGIHEEQQVYPKLNLSSHQLVALQSETLLPAQPSASAAAPASTFLDARIDYQRRCIPTEDGGVLALDWPTCVDLETDHGLDTTLLLIPGTAEGSRDEHVKLLVQSSLQSGFFPIVMNPRGCGDSPLTTPRICSAADSDDVRATVSYIVKSRPWTTVTGMGFGYGANMLAKYLIEDNTLSPLTAAVCINNPFDLSESAKYIRQNYRGRLDKEMTDGLVQILKSNKMLFQGQRHKFDVAGGVTATSVREFDAAISCWSNGFESVDDFYASASCGERLDEIKVPLLCIQDTSIAPLFSIPQVAFERNPYTTLLYTSTESARNAATTLALEWLVAVEVALLKGRHPALEGVDLAIKPSKDWSRAARSSLIGESLVTKEEDKYIVVEHGEDFWGPQESLEISHESEGACQSKLAEATEETTEETGQVLQAAQSIFGTLDVVMPGTLTDESKKQVLDAVGSGESIITALQNAVPEDVRGKLATSVSAAVQARGISLQLVGFGKNFPPPTLPAGLKESIQEKISSVTKGGLPGGQNAEVTIATGDPEIKSSEPTSKGEASHEIIPDVKTNPSDGRSDSGDKPAAASEGEDGAEAQKTETKSAAAVEGESAKATQLQASKVPNIDMKQALEALTGFDDSTQMAVNNVFGVLEDMLEKVEKEKEVPVKTESGKQASVTEGGNQQPPAELKKEIRRAEEPMEELDNVHYRLKRTRISGFILHENETGSGEQPGEHLSGNAGRIVLNAITNEVQRRLGAAPLESIPGLEAEVKNVAAAVMEEVEDVQAGSKSSCILPAEGLVNAVASALQDTRTLRQVVPVGLLVGVTLASLATSFEVIRNDPEKNGKRRLLSGEDTPSVKDQGLGGRMVGAVSAAMGATTAFATTPFRGKEERTAAEQQPGEYEERENPVSSIAEKAVSVAAPVVPTTRDGEVDHDRLVAMLAELGQKAGFLKFVGKAALLWGGLRGAMNVTDRLLMFFQIADRPLHQRLFGFGGMLLVMWSPVFVPLLPSLLNEWASKSSGGVAKSASVVGLYGALMILVTIWGKKIRGYKKPLREYGLRFGRDKLGLFAGGLMVGCTAVTFLYSILAWLGYVHFIPAFLLRGSIRQVALSAGKLLWVTSRALAIGLAVSVVEEVLFRSWLLEEIAADLGYRRAMLLSGLVFAVMHWSLRALPGLWFLAIALAGARLRLQGDLSLAIGLHTGLVATNFLLNSGGFISYVPGSSSNWLTGFGAGNPLAGFFGAAMACLFALMLYPWKVKEESRKQVTESS